MKQEDVVALFVEANPVPVGSERPTGPMRLSAPEPPAVAAYLRDIERRSIPVSTITSLDPDTTVRPQRRRAWLKPAVALTIALTVSIAGALWIVDPFSGPAGPDPIEVNGTVTCTTAEPAAGDALALDCTLTTSDPLVSGTAELRGDLESPAGVTLYSGSIAVTTPTGTWDGDFNGASGNLFLAIAAEVTDSAQELKFVSHFELDLEDLEGDLLGTIEASSARTGAVALEVTNIGSGETGTFAGSAGAVCPAGRFESLSFGSSATVTKYDFQNTCTDGSGAFTIRTQIPFSSKAIVGDVEEGSWDIVAETGTGEYDGVTGYGSVVSDTAGQWVEWYVGVFRY